MILLDQELGGRAGEGGLAIIRSPGKGKRKTQSPSQQGVRHVRLKQELVQGVSNGARVRK